MDDQRDYQEEAYWRAFCDPCGQSPCGWDGTPDGFHTDEPAVSEPVTYYFNGTTRNGVGRSGVTSESPAVFAERMFGRGWRWLRVITNDDSARVVARITRSGDDPRRRVWWAETE